MVAVAERDYSNISKNGITAEERKDLPALLEPLSDVYKDLNAGEEKIKKVNDLRAKIQYSVKLYDNELVFLKIAQSVADGKYKNEKKSEMMYWH